MKKNKLAVPTVYLDFYLEEYRKGSDLGEIYQEIISVYEQHKEDVAFASSILTDFEKARERICLKLITLEKNQEMLEEAPYIVFQDLAITFYVSIPENNGSFSVTINHSMLESWGNGRKALVIELYPAVSVKKSGHWDLSAMHLINYADELGWGEVRIINLCSTVFASKPYVKELKSDIENTAYIRVIFEEEAVKDYDIVIAWGSFLEIHATTMKTKAKLLDLLKEKGLENQVKHIITDSLGTNGQTGTHPLYLGPRHAKEIWKLQPYPLEKTLEELKKGILQKPEKKNDTTSSFLYQVSYFNIIQYLNVLSNEMF